jgi:hypothetical protein
VGKKAVRNGSSKRTTPLWKNLAVETILVIVGFSVIVYGLAIYRVPDAIPKTVRETLTVNYHSPSKTVTSALGHNYTILTPPINFYIVTTFKAQGGFGADNPITISALITEANNTVTDYYCCLSFWNAVPANDTTNAQHDWLPLKNWGNGTYTADGVLEWPDGGPTYTWLWPNHPANVTATYRVGLDIITYGGRTPTLTISPISDTLAWQDAQRNTRLELIGLGIVIIGPYEAAKRRRYSVHGEKDAPSIRTESSEGTHSEKYEYDVFICHASEDKDEIARPLAEALTKRDLRVWYDEFTLRVGDSLRRAIDHGLANSRYGVVILSPSFFKKNWTQKELDGLVAREDDMQKVILPVWHRVNHDEVVKFSPILAGKVAAKTEDGLDTVAEKICEAMEPQISLETERRRLRFHLELLEEELDRFVQSYRSFFGREPTDEVVIEAQSLLAIETQIGSMDLGSINEHILQAKEVTSGIIELSIDLSRWMEDEATNMGRPD